MTVALTIGTMAVIGIRKCPMAHRDGL